MKETNYQIDTDKNQIHVEREFDAPGEQVWRAWTEPELLDQWWAPKPYKTNTKTMEFKSGSRWHYYMQGPEGDVHWCMANYISIEPHKSIQWQDCFCDEAGNENKALPSTHWNIVFTPVGNITKVNVILTYASKEQMETIIGFGFKEGFAMAHNNLDELISQGKLK